MTDPYKVLGVSPSDSEDQIKQAYRDLARKYHPDNYINNPLSELATEKMKEINAAYEQIRDNKQGKTNARTPNPANTSYEWGQHYNQSSQFADIRRMLQNGMGFQALELLEGVPAASRDGEWYFLKGRILYNRGWLDEAYSHFHKATQIDPNNPEYQRALAQILNQRQNAQNKSATYSNSSCCSPCTICSTIICADCTCSVCKPCFGLCF